MGLYRDKKSPFWLCSYTLPNGKRIRESTKETVKSKAQAFLAKRLTAAKEPNRKTISTLLDNLLSDYRINDKSIHWCEIVVEKHLRPVFGQKKVESLTKQDVIAYIDKRKSKGRANATVNREVSLLRRAFTLADEAFPRIEKLEENNIRTGFLTDEEFLRLLSACSTHLKPIVMFAYKTGCRCSEILSLKWSQIDTKNAIVRLNPGETKNKLGRVIPLDSQLKRMLENMEQVSEFVFTYRGKRLNSIKGSFESATIKAKLPGLLFHDLRRCAIRNLSRAGVPETVSMAISGHKTRSVFDRYNIVSEADLHEAMKRRESTLTRNEKDAEAVIREGVSKFEEKD